MCRGGSPGRREVRRRELVAVALFALSCSRPDAGPPARDPATPLDPATTGNIEGVVRLEGPAPARTRLRLAGDPACVAVHGESVDAGDLLVEGGRVGNAFVYVARGLEGRVFERPTESVTIDQRGCLFVPRVSGAQTGQPIEFINSDAMLHNVHMEPKRSSGTNFGMAVKGARRTIHIDAPEVMVGIRCDVHPWMRAYLGVLEHPYFAVTRSDGSFRLAHVPAGDYMLAVWHERLGRQELNVTVRPEHSTTVELRFGGGAP